MSSQQLSNDSTVIVPVKTLRNALLMKASYNNCQNELEVARDSVKLQTTIIKTQDESIVNLVKQTQIYKANEQNYEGVIENKDNIITLKNQKITRLENKIKGAILTLTVSTVGFILLLL